MRDDPVVVELSDGRSAAGGISDSSAGFEAWIAPHLGVLRALAERQVGASMGADVVQEALLRAWRRRATFDPERGTPRAWLVAILLDQARRARLRHPRVAFGQLPQQQPVTLPAGDRLDVERAVNRLPRRQRQVVTLHYLADLPVSDIAVVLGISESSVKSHLSAGRAALRTLLEFS